jgi:hypothetical protein
MAIPILPILGTLSGVASTAWDTYAKIKRAKETALGKAGQDAVVDRVGKLEDACLEQARMLSELSKDLDQFAQAIQAELEEVQRRYRMLKGVLAVSLIIGCLAVGAAVYLLSR